MSTATQNGQDSRVAGLLTNRAKRNGKAIPAKEAEPIDRTVSIDQAIKDDPSVTTAAISASTAPSLSVQSRDALERAYLESFDRSVQAIGSLLDNTALSVYCQVGADCFDTIYRAKDLLDAETRERLGNDAKSTWKVDDFEDQCHQLSTRCRVRFPHLFRQSKENADKAEAENKRKRNDPIRISDFILAFKTVEAIRPLTGDAVDALSYFLIVNYVGRKVVSFSRTDLTCTMKADWSEFVRVNIPRLASGKILVRDFLSLMEEHEGKLTEAAKEEKNAGKTPEQIAEAEKAEAAKKATREKNAKRKRVETALDDALSNAMSGVLTPAEVSGRIANVAKSANVKLPASALDPETITADEILNTLRAMFMAKRFDEVRAVVEGCVNMAPMLASFDPKPQADQPAVKAG